MRYLNLLILTCCISLLLPLTSFAKNDYINEVQAQMLLIKGAALGNGWENTHNEKIGSLNRGEINYLNLILEKGMTYKIVSVCDNDCSDLDLVLFDENDNTIDIDKSSDDLPVVEVTPKWSGPFSLKVQMHSCSNDPCYYGVSVVGR